MYNHMWNLLLCTMRGWLQHWLTFWIPSECDTTRAHVDELVGGWKADRPRKVGEDDGRFELQDDDGIALDGWLDHADDPSFLFPRSATVESNGRKTSHPFWTALSATINGQSYTKGFTVENYDSRAVTFSSHYHSRFVYYDRRSF